MNDVIKLDATRADDEKSTTIDMEWVPAASSRTPQPPPPSNKLHSLSLSRVQLTTFPPHQSVSSDSQTETICSAHAASQSRLWVVTEASAQTLGRSKMSSCEVACQHDTFTTVALQTQPPHPMLDEEARQVADVATQTLPQPHMSDVEDRRRL